MVRGFMIRTLENRTSIAGLPNETKTREVDMSYDAKPATESALAENAAPTKSGKSAKADPMVLPAFEAASLTDGLLLLPNSLVTIESPCRRVRISARSSA